MKVLFQNLHKEWLGICRRMSFLILGISLFSQQAMAGEGIFGRSYLTDTLPKGKWEVEQTYWGKYGNFHGSYANSHYRTEVEYGVTDRFQEAIYVNYRHTYANKDMRDGTTGGHDVPENASPDKPYNALAFETISFESIYRLLSPYKDPIGLALYLEPGFGPNKIEIEPKLILQKNFLEDRLIWAFNLTWELEWERQTGGVEIESESEGEEPGLTKKRWTKETEFETSTGLMYRFARKWWGGLEFRHHSEIGSFNPKDIEHFAFFAGPTIHYGGQRFWITANVLLQLPFGVPINEENQENTEKDFGSVGRIFGDEHYKVEVRVKMGYAF